MKDEQRGTVGELLGWQWLLSIDIYEINIG